MTIPNTARKAGPLLGTGSQTAWPFTFKVFAAGDVQVTIANSAGTETLLVLGTDYTVTLNSNQDTSPGGTVNYPISGAALPVGSVLAIIGDLDYDQPLDLPSGGNFSPLALENQLDRVTMQIQQLKEEVDRSAKLPPTSTESVEALVDDLQRIADSADNLDTVADNIADIATVADDLNEPVSEINTVAGAIANVNAVGSNITNVNTVAGISANVTTVAGIAANVTAVAAIDDDVAAVAGVAAAVTAVAAIDDDVTIAAANVADITNFADVYQGPKASDPALRNDGGALQAGDLYFNTTNDEMRVYGGTLWKSGFVGTVAVQNFSGNGSTTAFTLTTAPGGENNTQIFIGGVYQQKDQYSVSGTTLTFSTAPTTGTNNIEVVTISTLALGETDAALVSFVQAGTGAVERTVQGELRERSVTPKQFGAVGDGVVDDTAAVQASLNSQKPIDWLGLAYRITTPVTQTVSRDVIWNGRGATIVYAGTHVEAAVTLTTDTGLLFSFENITVDGSKLCNTPLKITSTAVMSAPSTFRSRNLSAIKAKRLNTFTGGEAIRITGSFDLVDFDGGRIFDCELPTGQGTPGVIGITGITVGFNTTDKWVRRCTLSGVEIEKVYSSNLSYQGDQDGIRYFVPDDATTTAGKKEGQLVVDGNCRFINCYGRSVKTQCRTTVVSNSSCVRNEGLSSGTGNTEIDAQTGPLGLFGCTFDYSNGQQPGFIARAIGNSTYAKNGLVARDCTVYLDSATTLEGFAQTFANSGYISSAKVDAISIYGKTKQILSFLCNGDKNYAEVSNCWLNSLVNGETSEKALVYVKTAGTSPYFANITIRGNYYDNTDSPSVCRTNIGASSMSANVSAWNNFGFIDDVATYVNQSGLRTNQAMALGKITGTEDQEIKGYHQIRTLVISNGATATIPVRRLWGGSLVLITAAGNNYALISSSNSANVAVAASANFIVGNTTNPGGGLFRVWSSATNELSIQNGSGSGQPITAWILAIA